MVYRYIRRIKIQNNLPARYEIKTGNPFYLYIIFKNKIPGTPAAGAVPIVIEDAICTP